MSSSREVGHARQWPHLREGPPADRRSARTQGGSHPLEQFDLAECVVASIAPFVEFGSDDKESLPEATCRAVLDRLFAKHNKRDSPDDFSVRDPSPRALGRVVGWGQAPDALKCESARLWV